MAASSTIILLTIVVSLILIENAECERDWRAYFQRKERHFNTKNSAVNKERRATSPTAKEKETNKLVLAALYGGLGLGVPSAANFDYANGLNSKIQTAGGYGIPPGIFSYAFDPTTGMPFMCDPTKTPPGGTSQTNKVAAVNPPTAVKKPKEDEPSGNQPSGNQPPVIQPSVNEPAANEPAANEPSANEPTANEPAANEPAANEPAANEPSANEPAANEPSVSEPSANEPVANQPSAKTNNDATNLGPLYGENTPGFNGQPEERLSPIQATSENQPAEKDTHPVSGTSTTAPPENDKTTAPTNAEHSDDIMTTSSPTNQQDNTANDGVTQTPDQQKTTSSVTESITSSGSNDITLSEHKTASLSNPSPQSDEVGNDASHDASDDASSHVQPSDASSPHKGTTVLLGTPLYANKPIKNSNEKSQSSSQNKETEQRLTPLIDNYKQGGATEDVKERQTNKMKTYIKKILKRNEISIKLPEIPACPDMKQYHWPWNCLEKGNKVRKNCIENYHGGTYSYNGVVMPYETYKRMYYYEK